jgi:hypothetical protein
MNECLAKKRDIDIKEWKRQGDEILFYIPHPHFDSLLQIPSDIFKALTFIIKAVKNFNKDSIIQLSVKATLWAADVRLGKGNDNHSLFNIVTISEDFSRIILDFLGPDIDTGFRIAKYASPGKLTIDINLAWIFNKYAKEQNCNVSENMRIVSLEELKGIWNERRYPIIWYYEEWIEA